MKKTQFTEDNLGVIQLSQSIGFSCVPDLLRTQSIQDGFGINVLIAGRRGLGSSTLINSLFGAPIISKTRSNNLTVTKNEIVENGISLETTVITYHSNDPNPILEYINIKNNEYFENEQGPYKIHKDTRIHVCLYLIPSDFMTTNEIELMKALSEETNFIPIIPKSDMYTNEELHNRKYYIYDLLQENSIRVFTCMQKTSTDSDNECMDIPVYAIIASETVYEINGEIIRGRQYPWGFINIDTEEGNDFKKLQRFLIYKNFDELINRTHIKFYNEYRKKMLKHERNNESSQIIRYKKLKQALEDVLREKTQKCFEILKNEEAALDEMLSKANISERSSNETQAN